MYIRDPVYRICKKCMRVWNVACIDPPGKRDYVCPVCDCKEIWVDWKEVDGDC